MAIASDHRAGRCIGLDAEPDRMWPHRASGQQIAGQRVGQAPPVRLVPCSVHDMVEATTPAFGIAARTPCQLDAGLRRRRQSPHAPGHVEITSLRAGAIQPRDRIGHGAMEGQVPECPEMAREPPSLDVGRIGPERLDERTQAQDQALPILPGPRDGAPFALDFPQQGQRGAGKGFGAQKGRPRLGFAPGVHQQTTARECEVTTSKAPLLEADHDVEHRQAAADDRHVAVRAVDRVIGVRRPRVADVSPLRAHRLGNRKPRFVSHQACRQYDPGGRKPASGGEHHLAFRQDVHGTIDHVPHPGLCQLRLHIVAIQGARRETRLEVSVGRPGPTPPVRMVGQPSRQVSRIARIQAEHARRPVDEMVEVRRAVGDTTPELRSRLDDRHLPRWISRLDQLDGGCGSCEAAAEDHHRIRHDAREA